MDVTETRRLLGWAVGIGLVVLMAAEVTIRLVLPWESLQGGAGNMPGLDILLLRTLADFVLFPVTTALIGAVLTRSGWTVALLLAVTVGLIPIVGVMALMPLAPLMILTSVPGPVALYIVYIGLSAAWAIMLGKVVHDMGAHAEIVGPNDG